jgi:hypothetical protein
MGIHRLWRADGPGLIASAKSHCAGSHGPSGPYRPIRPNVVWAKGEGALPVEIEASRHRHALEGRVRFLLRCSALLVRLGNLNYRAITDPLQS